MPILIEWLSLSWLSSHMFNHHMTIAYHACVASYELAIMAIIHFNELAGNYVFCVMHMCWLLARLLFAVLALCFSSLAHLWLRCILPKSLWWEIKQQTETDILEHLNQSDQLFSNEEELSQPTKKKKKKKKRGRLSLKTKSQGAK